MSVSFSLENTNVGNVNVTCSVSDNMNDPEISICLICVKNIESVSSPNIVNVGRLYLFEICCKLLRIELTDHLIDMWNNSTRLSICETCENALDSFIVLHDQFVSIKSSIRKIENDTKIQIIKSQKAFQSSKTVCAENDEYLFKSFCDQALKDFSPILQLNKINLVQPKSKRPIRKKRKINVVVVDLPGEKFEDIVIKEERFDFLEDNMNPDYDFSLNDKNSENKCKTEILDETEDLDFDSRQFDDEDLGSDSDYNPSGGKQNSAKPSSEKGNSENNSTHPKLIRSRKSSSNASDKKRKRIKKNRINEKFPPPKPTTSEANYSFRSIEYSFDDAKNVFQCGSCSVTRKNHHEMRGHISNCHPVEGFGKWSYKGVKYSLEKESGHLKCTLCNKTLTSRDSMNKHIRGRHNEEGKILTTVGKEYKAKNCKNPPLQLEDGKWLYKGVEITEDKSTGDFRCGNCERVRKSKASMLLHIMEAHDDAGKLENQCQQCSAQFGTPYHLKIHMDTHITKSHQCEQCGQVFQQRANMFRHIARIHKQIRPFVCEYCAKSFFSRKDCRVHVRTHTKEKPYFCEVPNCGMSFSLLATKQKHECNVHSNNNLLFNKD